MSIRTELCGTAPRRPSIRDVTTTWLVSPAQHSRPRWKGTLEERWCGMRWKVYATRRNPYPYRFQFIAARLPRSNVADIVDLQAIENRSSSICVPDITIILLFEHYCMSFVLKYSHVAMITQCRLLPSLIHLSLDVSMCHLFS